MIPDAGIPSGGHPAQAIHPARPRRPPELALGIQSGLEVGQRGQPAAPYRRQPASFGIPNALPLTQPFTELGIAEEARVQLAVPPWTVQAGADELVDFGLGLQLQQRQRSWRRARSTNSRKWLIPSTTAQKPRR